jgi:hypothetical protein
LLAAYTRIQLRSLFTKVGGHAFSALAFTAMKFTHPSRSFWKAMLFFHVSLILVVHVLAFYVTDCIKKQILKAPLAAETGRLLSS